MNCNSRWKRDNNDIRSLRTVIPVMELEKILARLFMKIMKLDDSSYVPSTI